MVARLEMNLEDLLRRIGEYKVVWDDRISFDDIRFTSRIHGKLDQEDYGEVDGKEYSNGFFHAIRLPVFNREYLLLSLFKPLQKFSNSRDLRLQAYLGYLNKGRVLSVESNLFDFKKELGEFRKRKRNLKNKCQSGYSAFSSVINWLENPHIIAAYEEDPEKSLSRISWLMMR